MGEGFLGRWSRRKQDVREGKALVEPPPPSVPVAAPLPASVAVAAPASVTEKPVDEPPAPTLADAQALTPASDFKPFVSPSVLPEVRNLAMKKLFSDPHFNVMDGLDIYIDDYTQPDPLPAGMLRQMASAHAMGFFDHEKETGSQLEADRAGAIAPAGTRPRDDAESTAAADVAQSGVCNAVPSVANSEPVLAAHSEGDGVALPASHTHDDYNAHLRLQPDDAPQREGVGRGAA